MRYDDHDPGRTVRVERVAYGTSDLTRDAVFGAGAVEIRLTKLLLLAAALSSSRLHLDPDHFTAHAGRRAERVYLWSEHELLQDLGAGGGRRSRPRVDCFG